MTIFRDIFVNILFTTVLIAYYFSIECNGSHLLEPYNTISRLKRQSNCGNSLFQCDNGQCVPQKELCNVCGKKNPKVRPLRDTAQRESAPWHVGIYRKKKTTPPIDYICGGALISTNVVLSVAHCFTSNDLGILNDINEYYIAAGKHYSAYDDPKDILAQKSKAKNIIIPSDYRGAATNYKSNIAIVVLETPFQISLVVQPVCVDWQNEFEDTQLRSPNNGIVTGWGIFAGDLNSSRELRQIEVPYVSQADCFKVMPKSFYPFLTKDTFCAGFSNETSICKGDSGGGLVFHKSDNDRYYIRGLVSVGPVKDGTCDTKPILYTRISSFMNIINETLLANRN